MASGLEIGACPLFPLLAAARAALQTPAPQAAVIEAAEDFLARVSGEDPRSCRAPSNVDGLRVESRPSFRVLPDEYSLGVSPNQLAK